MDAWGTHQLMRDGGVVFRGVLGGFGVCFVLVDQENVGGCGLSRLCLRHGGLG
jgi:hypothetical protein